MNKKGLLISIACTVVLTLGLAIYTLVSVLGAVAPQKPKDISVALAFRTNDIVNELSLYDEDDMTFTYSDETNKAIEYDESENHYIAKVGGEVSVKVKLDNIGNTKTFDITVYDQEFDADGKPTNTIIITSKEHLIEYAELANSTASDSKNYRGYAVELHNDIDLAGINWKPIGTRQRPFYGTFNGNGYVIKNMNIHVTTANVSEYVAEVVETADTKVSMYIGFFGVVSGLSDDASINNNISFAGTAIGEINNVNFDNAFIKIDESVKAELSTLMASKNFIQSGVGILAGRIYGTTVDGENASLTNCVIDGYSVILKESASNGVGGLVGVALKSSKISNYNVEINIINDTTSASSTINNKLYANYVGGLVGLFENNHSDAEQSVLEKCSVNVTATILADNRTGFGGAVGFLTNVVVDDITIVADVSSNSARRYDEDAMSAVGGAFFVVDIDDRFNTCTAKITNVKVTLDASVFGNVAGFVVQNSAIIENCKIESAGIYAYNASGFVYKNEHTISYDETFEGVAVTATLRGFINSGFAYVNANTINGDKNSTDNYTKINITINSLNKIFDSKESENTYANSVGSVGFVNKIRADEFAAVVTNFDVTVSIRNDVNQVGLVFNLGTTQDIYAATLKNMKVVAKMESVNTINGTEEISTTKFMAGAVARMFGKGVLDSVEVEVYANKDVDTAKLYGAEFFGGLVARILEDGAQVANSSVKGYAYFNTSNYYANVDDGVGSENAVYQVSLVGGLVGSISNDSITSTSSLDMFEAISTANIKISNNTVKDLELVVNIGRNDIVAAGSTTANRWRFRALGATIGSAINTTSTITFTGNNIENVTITTVPGDYTYTGGNFLSSMCGTNRSYGIANVVIIDDTTGINDIEYITL